MGTQRCSVATDRTDLATEATLRWSRSSVARHASSPQRYFVGLGDGGTVARAGQEVSAVPDLPSSFPAVGAAGQVGTHLAYLAEKLQARGKLQLEEAFIDASFTGAKKEPSRSGPANVARERKSSLSPMITVLLSPLVSKALRRTKATSSSLSSACDPLGVPRRELLRYGASGLHTNLVQAIMMRPTRSATPPWDQPWRHGAPECSTPRAPPRSAAPRLRRT